MQAQSSAIFVIDAGHGGEDGGAVGSDGLRESEVNLAVALRLDAMMGLMGYPCRLTRSCEDIPYPPEAKSTRERKRADQKQRIQQLHETEGAILISIHQNIYPAASPHGAQVFFGPVEGSRQLAELTQARLNAVTAGNRNAAPIADSIYLLREADCPAILIECGFLSNRAELALLHTDAYRTKLALGIAAACADLYEEWNSSYG